MHSTAVIQTASSCVEVRVHAFACCIGVVTHLQAVLVDTWPRWLHSHQTMRRFSPSFQQRTHRFRWTHVIGVNLRHSWLRVQGCIAIYGVMDLADQVRVWISLAMHAGGDAFNYLFEHHKDLLALRTLFCHKMCAAWPVEGVGQAPRHGTPEPRQTVINGGVCTENIHA